jgi:hypothetical protein
MIMISEKIGVTAGHPQLAVTTTTSQYVVVVECFFDTSYHNLSHPSSPVVEGPITRLLAFRRFIV